MTATPLEVAWPSIADRAGAFDSVTCSALEAIRDILLELGDGTYLLRPQPDISAVEPLTRWHQRHPHCAYLDIVADVHLPPSEPVDLRIAGTTRWAAPAAFRNATLPSLGELLQKLSGPRDLLVAGVVAVLALPPSEQPLLGSHALLAGLSSAGGVVVATRGQDATETLSRDDWLDPAERLAAYRPPEWSRLQREPGYSVVVDANGVSTSALSDTVDGFLGGSRSDIEIAVRGRQEQQELLARRYAEDPRFRSLGKLHMGPRVLLVRGTSAPNRETLADLARIHEIHAAGLVLVVQAGEAGRHCGASYETGAWARAAAFVGDLAERGRPTLEDLHRVLEPHYRTWRCSADEVGLRRHGGGTAPSDLLDGTSAPERWVLDELEKHQRLASSSRSDLRNAQKEIERLRKRPTERLGRAIRRRLG